MANNDLQDLLSEFDPLSRPASTGSTSRTPLFPPVSPPQAPDKALSTANRIHSLSTTAPLQDDPLSALGCSNAAKAPPVQTGGIGVEATRRTQLRQEALRQHLNREPFQLSRPPTPLVVFDDDAELASRSSSAPVASGSGPSTHVSVTEAAQPSTTRLNGFRSPGAPSRDNHSRNSSPAKRTKPRPWSVDVVDEAGGASERSTPPSVVDPADTIPGPVRLQGFREGMLRALDEDLADALRDRLPRRLRVSPAWELLYSLDRDGTSLQTVYRRVGAGMPRDSATGLLIVVLDSEGHRFGAFVNEALRPSKEYYGNGECFLWRSFHFPPTDVRIGVGVQAYPWTGQNNYMVLSDQEIISVGGGDGRFGLCVDATLEKGSSARCPTFNNDVLCEHAERTAFGREEGAFQVTALEMWRIAL